MPTPLRCLALCLFLVAQTAGSIAEAGPSPFPLIGKIAPRSARDIASSSWSIGCEVLDRDFASYAAYKHYLGPLGAKGVRLQAGWAKTEKQPGVYSWQWLDEIIDDTRAQGTQPWVQFSYGNPAYPEGGGIQMGDAPPTGTALAAWDRWVTATVRRYRDRVQAWEIWNEPDIWTKISLPQYVDLFIRTATIVRAEQPQARIYALSLAHKAGYAREFLTAVSAAGKLDLVDAITFHGYPHNPDDLAIYEDLRMIVAEFPRKIELRQGETGAPSGPTTGALRDREWTESKQTKWNLCRMLAFHGRGVPVNLFTLSEFYYPHGRNAKGLLRINPDLSVVGPKPAYFAAQNVFAIFDDSLQPAPACTVTSTSEKPLAAYVYRHTGSRRHSVTLWFNGEAPDESPRFQPVDFVVRGAVFDQPVYVDLQTGNVSALPAANWSQHDGVAEFRGIPLHDSPILIANRADLPIR